MSFVTICVECGECGATLYASDDCVRRAQCDLCNKRFHSEGISPDRVWICISLCMIVYIKKFKNTFQVSEDHMQPLKWPPLGSRPHNIQTI